MDINNKKFMIHSDTVQSKEIKERHYIFIYSFYNKKENRKKKKIVIKQCDYKNNKA